MKHKGVRLVVVTGGPGVVKEAMASGKKVIAAGPGNPPAVVDETANLEVAARGIVAGASIDNNIICVSEKEIIAVSSIADRLRDQLGRNGCLLLNERQVRDLEKVILEGQGTNKNWVGKNAGLIARRLIKAGANPLLPAAAVQRGTWPDQKVVESTLGSLAADLKRHKVKAPAILVIGRVAGLRRQLADAAPAPPLKRRRSR